MKIGTSQGKPIILSPYVAITSSSSAWRGDLPTALALYREAAAGTAEAVSRDPTDPQRLYDHAQNQFYLADIATQQGQMDRAERAFREYKRLADQMVALAPHGSPERRR